MAELSKIEWTDHTFNPWIGCQAVSPGCDFCYAEAWDKRFGGEHFGPRAPRHRTSDANWNKPYVWDRKARAEGRRFRIFPSLCDPFDNAVPREWRSSFWRVIAQTPNLDWLLLTKRPENIADMLPPDWGDGWPGVWLGVSVEDQQRADERIPLLLDTPAALRWVSAEPLLGPVDWRRFFRQPASGIYLPAVRGLRIVDSAAGPGGLDWLIAGGESGPRARPFDIQWARSTIAQCRAAGVPVFVKQLGGRVYDDSRKADMPPFPADATPEDIAAFTRGFTRVYFDHAKGGNPDEWSADLRVREFPKAAA